jgi:shikimate kinase
VEQLLKRTNKDKKRPLLQTADPKAQIEKLLADREPFYKDVADIELRTGVQSIQYVVSVLIRKLNNLDKLT